MVGARIYLAADFQILSELRLQTFLIRQQFGKPAPRYLGPVLTVKTVLVFQLGFTGLFEVDPFFFMGGDLTATLEILHIKKIVLENRVEKFLRLDRITVFHGRVYIPDTQSDQNDSQDCERTSETRHSVIGT